MRTYDVTLADLPEQHTAVVRGPVTLDGVGPFIGAALGAVMAALSQHGEEPAGMPFARYHPVEDGFLVEAGFPVRQPWVAAGGVEGSTLPAGSVARVMHRGSYAEVAAAYEAAVRWIDVTGHQQSGDPWELYLDETDVAEPRTEVFVPCRPAHR